ncbi:MAG: tRNA (adenosine(37)-N6)-dimethylallyltransferase MiaA [Bacteroidota bacterium]
MVGPTAVGKTSFAIKVAIHFQTEIISSDSRQFFAEMSIGTAKPNEHELQEVKHHFVGNVSINTLYSAGDFERDALKKLDELFIKNSIVAMVGGSGLYTKAVLEGLDEMPKADEKLRTELQQLFDEKGIAPLQEILKKIAPEKFAIMDIQNTQRVMRAIEISSQQNVIVKEKTPRKFIPIKIGLNLERENLYNRINQRVDQMMEAGLLAEAKSLYDFKHLNALQTVGYTELFDYFDGRQSLEKAIELIKQHTRNFAKRQLTWFRKEKDIHWFEPEDINGVIALIEKELR